MQRSQTVQSRTLLYVTTVAFFALTLLIQLLLFSVPLRAQIEPIANLKVVPIPLPGGDIFPPYGLYNQFFPGPPNQTPPFDPMNSDPHGITNFRGVTAMGYTSGPATDNSGNAYTVMTDSTAPRLQQAQILYLLMVVCVYRAIGSAAK